nr:reverse transcriptase domain-containing protein [Tanacetum cinerariifolium]
MSLEDASDEPLIIEAVVEGYLVHRVYVDQGVSVEVVLEHCFEKLSPAMKSRLRCTQIDLVGCAGSVMKSLGKIKLEVVFEDGGLFRRVMINFTVVQAPSPYNVILERTRGNLSEGCKNQLNALLKKSMDVFAWEPADVTCILRRIIEHILNFNPLMELVTKKRVLASGRSQVVIKEVEEWVKVGIVCPLSKGSGAGLVLISPRAIEFAYALRLNFTSITNEAEYESLLAGLRMAAKMKVQVIDVKVDSKLVASQINENYVASTSMIKYLATTRECIVRSSGGSVAKRLIDRKEVSAIVEEEEDNWKTPIIQCLAKGTWLEDKDERRALRMKINQYVLE